MKGGPNACVAVVSLVVALCVAPAVHGAAERSVSPDPKACRAATTGQARWLDQQWKEFMPFVRVCPIRDTRARTVLLLVSTWAELYYADKPSGTATVAMPRPLLFLPGGVPVGSLPVNYPDDPPHELAVAFTAWRRGFPERINLTMKSPTVAEGQKLPSLVWDGTARRYVAEP